MTLWDSINDKRKAGRDPVVRAFDVLMRGGPGPATKAMENAGRDLGAAVRKGDPEAVLMSAYLLVKDGKAAAARMLLRQHESLSREHGDLAYMRGETELRAGYTPISGVAARRWGRLARSLGVSSSVNLRPLRTSAQAMILLVMGVALAVGGTVLRVLPTSWRAVGVVAGAAVSLPALQRQFAWHPWWAVALALGYVALFGIAVQ